MSAKKSVEIFYDVLSPYAWIGFEGINRCAQKWNINLHLRPFYLGGVMGATGNSPPGVVPAKARYAQNDLHRMRSYMQIPFKPPSDFMGTVIVKGSLSAQRLLTAASLTMPDKLEALSRTLWLRIWGSDKDITEVPSLIEACQAAGIAKAEAVSLVDQIKDPKVKDALKKTTEEAVEHGAYGAPTFLVEGKDGKKEMVFGSDRFHTIAYILGEEYLGPLNELAKTKL